MVVLLGGSVEDELVGGTVLHVLMGWSVLVVGGRICTG